MRPIRVSFINFLNSVPLGWGFLRGSLRDRFDVLFDVPSRCARRLADGDADLGLIPVIEHQRIPGLRVVPEISVSSRHDVRSVLCVSRAPLESARRIALDPSSRTSVALLKILLARHFGNADVRFIESEPNLTGLPEGVDAALVIGNPALQMDTSGLRVYDLAREWHHLTGLPCVFAFWAVREETPQAEELAGWLLQSRTEGLDAIPRIAAEYGPALGLSVAETERYLTRHLDYGLDASHRQALERFFDLASELHLIERQRPLRWLPGAPVERP